MLGRILVVDDVVTNRIVLKGRLAEAFYQPLLAADGKSCLRMARSERPDLILLDPALPDIGGIEVLEQLRRDPVACAIPVIVVAPEDGPALRIAAFRAGADDVLTRPLEDQVLLARLRNLIAARKGIEDLAPDPAFGLHEQAADFMPGGMIGIVATSPDRAEALRRQLAFHMRCHIATLDRETAFGGATAPDIYVIDAGAAGDGLQLMSELRCRERVRNAGFCILRRADARPGQIAFALDLGAGDVVAPDVDPAELAVRLHALLRRKAAADRRWATVQDGLRMAVVDPLTGLHNRRYGNARLTEMIEQARITRQPLAVMLADIDRFKRINDGWGHAAGDAVLVEIARRLKSGLGEGGLLARYGGEEFLIAVPGTHLDAAQTIARRICAGIEQKPLLLPGGEKLHVTASIGLTISNAPAHETAGDVVNRADRALLVSKAEGRNQVTVARSAA